MNPKLVKHIESTLQEMVDIVEANLSNEQVHFHLTPQGCYAVIMDVEPPVFVNLPIRPDA